MTAATVKVKADKIETRLDAAFSQMKGMNKDINDSLHTLEDKQEYLENKSRQNNIKIFGLNTRHVGIYSGFRIPFSGLRIQDNVMKTH